MNRYFGGLLFIVLYLASCVTSVNVTPAYSLMPVVVAKAELLLKLYFNPSLTRLGSSKIERMAYVVGIVTIGLFTAAFKFSIVELRLLVFVSG